MKKFSDKMLKEEDDRHTDSTVVGTIPVGCDCCYDPSSLSPKATRNVEGKQYEVDEGEDHAHNDNQKNTRLLNDKLLIITGLALTIPIVLLELLLPTPHSFIIESMMLALATPTQILLGRPFYYRFFDAVVRRKRFTTETLVVLSTSVAYFYSLFSLLFTNSHVQFYEASSSVLTIFTIGEYQKIE